MAQHIIWKMVLEPYLRSDFDPISCQWEVVGIDLNTASLLQTSYFQNLKSQRSAETIPLWTFSIGTDVDAASLHLLRIHSDRTVSFAHMLGKPDTP